MSLRDFLLLLAAGAGAAFMLGVAVELAHWRKPERKGFEVHHDQ